jgi:hypothetical protein
VIREIIHESQNSSLEVRWNGFKCDQREMFKLAVIKLLGNQRH